MNFFGRSALFCGALMMLATPAAAEKTVKWKLAMTWPSTLTPFASSVARFAQNVSDMTGGKFVLYSNIPVIPTANREKPIHKPDRR